MKKKERNGAHLRSRCHVLCAWRPVESHPELNAAVAGVAWHGHVIVSTPLPTPPNPEALHPPLALPARCRIPNRALTKCLDIKSLDRRTAHTVLLAFQEDTHTHTDIHHHVGQGGGWWWGGGVYGSSPALFFSSLLLFFSLGLA